MINAKIRKFAGLTTAALLLLAAGAGCDKTDSQSAEATATGATSATGTSSANTNSANTNSANKQRYGVLSPREPVAVNKKAKVELAITPADGLKINKDFPWSLEFSETPGVQLAQKSISKAQIDLDDSKATIPVMLEASAAGAHTLEASADFSVCNDTKCYVIRDERLSFDLAAQEAAGDKAAGDEAGEVTK